MENKNEQTKKLEEKAAAKEQNYFIKAYEKYRTEKALQTEERHKKSLFNITQRYKEGNS